MNPLQPTSRNRAFGGWQDVYRHRADTLACQMNVGVYSPPQAETQACPVLIWLSGLTCTEQNFVTKAGAQRLAAEHGVIVVAPDTSPRGDDVPDDEAWDLGQGAGFYLDATESPWKPHYQMHSYVVDELHAWIKANFNTTGAVGITGHSMGGHGALVAALRRPGQYVSASAISAIAAPTQCPWGQKAFTAYLGVDRSTWAAWDASALIAKATERLPLLVDVGAADSFLSQLMPEALREACAVANHPLTLRLHAEYDHSYYFVASVLAAHFEHHAPGLFGR